MGGRTTVELWSPKGRRSAKLGEAASEKWKRGAPAVADEPVEREEERQLKRTTSKSHKAALTRQSQPSSTADKPPYDPVARNCALHN